jgi:predicted N-formylglutamate amidohydrolase
VASDFILITCEQGSNRIPAPYLPLFRTYRTLLDSHCGYDPGALQLARDLADAFGATLVASTTSRLLIDLNRSLGHPRLYSEPTRGLSAEARAEIAIRHFRPYRAEVERRIGRAVATGKRAIHLSCHSFTPVFRGDVRRADVGLLYDPARQGEVELCARWKRFLEIVQPDLEVRRNYPYAGNNDGLTTSLRRLFGPRTYLGVENEINQSDVSGRVSNWCALRAAVIESATLVEPKRRR